MFKSLVLSIAVLVLVSAAAALTPYEAESTTTPETQIDKIVFARLKQLGIEPANPCSDTAFVRRVYLDIIGTIPTPAETIAFVKDAKPDKRALLIDKLLEREEFADYWSMRWADLLRIKAEFPVNLWPNAVQAYHHWVRAGIKANKPYDQFVRELLLASGSNFRDPAVNFYRSVQGHEKVGIAQAVALTWMGMRAENWPKERLAGMSAFFCQIGFKSTAEWKEEIVYWDPDKGPTTKPITATFPDGTTVQLPPDRDPREVFVEWFVRPENPYFTRNIANRAWCWLQGRGVIHEPDDIRPDNPPANPELLAYLEKELIASKYDLKHLFRLILNSRTYQLASVPRSKDPRAEANFAFYPIRRLDAEVLIDAVNQITGGTEKYVSPIPEPFTYIPETQRSIALADGSINSPFLEMFGRPARDTGWESERNNKPSAAQRLHFLNSSNVQRKIEDSKQLQAIWAGKGGMKEITGNLYMLILSRQPTEEEVKAAEAYVTSGHANGREGVIDITWALLNSVEFLYRH